MNGNAHTQVCKYMYVHVCACVSVLQVYFCMCVYCMYFTALEKRMDVITVVSSLIAVVRQSS